MPSQHTECAHKYYNWLRMHFRAIGSYSLSSAVHWQEAIQLADVGNMSELTASEDFGSPREIISSSSETESDFAELK